MLKPFQRESFVVVAPLQLMERSIKKMGKSADKLQKHLDVSLGEIKRLDFIISQFLGHTPHAATASARERQRIDRGNRTLSEARTRSKQDQDQAGAAFRSALHAAGREPDEAGVPQPDPQRRAGHE